MVQVDRVVFSKSQLFIFKVEEIFHEQKKQKPIAAVIIEPILAEGGKRSCFAYRKV